MVYSKRRETYFNKIEPSISILFSGKKIPSTADEFYPFEINRNFYYLTGIDQPNLILMLLKGQDLNKEILFIEESDPSKELWVGPRIAGEEASKLSGIQDIYFLKDFDAVLLKYLSISRKNNIGLINTIYLDLERQSLDDFYSEANELSHKIKSKFPYLIIKNAFLEISKMRLVKSKDEIEEIKKAISITKEGIYRIMKFAKPGMYEYQLESFYDQVLKFCNVKQSFKTIIASGVNATTLHYEKNNTSIKNEDLVLLDLGVNHNYYASDISRTFPINGTFTERQKQIYEIVLEANKKTIAFLKPGILWSEFHEFGKQILIEGCKKIGLIKEDDEIYKYYYHSLGHSLGLDVHDVGYQEGMITEGVIVTVEPGLYIATEGIGIRIEDDVLITANGSTNLSKDIIKEISEIEKYMKKGE